MKRHLVPIFLLFITIQALAQNYVLIDSSLTRQQDILRNEQAEVILNLANRVLEEVPPQTPEPVERTMALYLLDLIFNDTHAPMRLPVQSFLYNRISNAATEIEKTKVENGAMIWKLYNHGFIIRTKDVTLAFDLIRPSRRNIPFPLGQMYTDKNLNDVSDGEAIDKIVRNCDVLFVSHMHEDHADDWVAQKFIEQNKPVVASPDVWQGQSFYKKVTHLDRDPNKLQKLKYKQGKKELKIVINPGHQTELLNNVTIVYTPDGYCFSHNGDQNSVQDTSWIFDIKNHHPIDVLMYNRYMSNRWIKGFDPKLIITGHENELGHGIHSRHSYWRYHKTLEGIPYPFIIMAWGEKFHYLKTD